MTHSTTLTPTEPHPTCATCPFFTGFNGEVRGLCDVFNRVFKKQNLRTSDCDRQIESLLAQPKTYTVMVELITSEVSDDGSGHAVPVASRTVELVVAYPIKGLVEAEIALQNNLQDWQVAGFWLPDGGYEI